MEKKTIDRLIRKKFYFKYVTLFCVLLLYIPLAGIIVTQFIFKEKFVSCFIAFIIHFFVVLAMNVVYEKVFVLPRIESLDVLYTYLKYFSSEHNYLEYTESITWFYRMICAEYKAKRDVYTDKEGIIYQLHFLLSPYGNGTISIAMNRMNLFRELAAELVSTYEKTEKFKVFSLEEMETFRNRQPEKYIIFKWIRDKNVLIYLSIFPLHILGCALLAITKEGLSAKLFVGNLLLYIPADIIAILLYNGVMKDSK